MPFYKRGKKNVIYLCKSLTTLKKTIRGEY
jgi:hypothetical protein